MGTISRVIDSSAEGARADEAGMNPQELVNIAAAEQGFWWYRGTRRIFFRMLDPFLKRRPTRRALEAGCGTGYFAQLLESRYGWRVFPVDLGWEGIQYGLSMRVERRAQADLSALPFSAGAFDVVTSMDVLIHFPKAEETNALREMVRVLAPGGTLVVRVSALDFLRSRHSEFTHERQRFTRGRLIRLATRCGVRVRRCTYMNSLLLPLALIKFRLWEPLLRRPPASGVTAVPKWLDTLLHFALALESVWLGAGLNLPFGQSLLLIGEKVV